MVNDMPYRVTKSYTGDPYWTTARFKSTCKKCGGDIVKGERIFYYPRTKTVYCEDAACGDAAYHDFMTMAEAEEYYSR